MNTIEKIHRDRDQRLAELIGRAEVIVFLELPGILTDEQKDSEAIKRLRCVIAEMAPTFGAARVRSDRRAEEAIQADENIHHKLKLPF